MGDVPTLLRPWVARLLGFAALALLGTMQWRRMVDDVSVGRAILWVAVATGAAVAVRASARSRSGWAHLGVAVLALLAAYAAAPLDLGLLKPARWDELGLGVSTGAEALATVRLPYDGPDPWPGQVLGLLGALLCVLAGLLAFWPRTRPAGASGHGASGYPFFALIALLTLVVTPVVSLGGTRPLVLGAGVAALIVCFLWLERLPLRPGFGVAAMLAFAIAGGVPLATATDREDPWFDYKSFAESIGPDRPQRFDFDASQYGPIDWPRDGGEVLRVHDREPRYLKVQVLDRFDGLGWRSGGALRDGRDPRLEDELGASFARREDWREEFSVTVRGLRDQRLAAAGTVLDIDAGDRDLEPGVGAEPWLADRELRSGDSYDVLAYLPQPSPAQLADVPGGDPGPRDHALWAEVPITDGAAQGLPRTRFGNVPDAADVRFRAWGQPGRPTAVYEELFFGVADGPAALRASGYARTWRLAQRLQADARTPYEYVRAVDDFLENGFRYTENPPRPAPGVMPLESFLFDSQAGYCQHYAGAMALLLRMGGIPARVVAGFSPGGYSDRKQAWVVRDTDAHAWVEAWFGEYGWITFDPTPPGTPARSQTAAIVDRSEVDSSGVAGNGGIGREPRPSGPGSDRAAGGGTGGIPSGAGDGALSDGLVAGGAALLALLGAGWVVARRRTRAGGLEYALRELRSVLRRAGRPLPATATLAQLERGFRGDARDYVGALREARYGSGTLPDRVAGRRALRRELAAGGGLRGRLRALWAVPPRP
jgi:transglutaminase-like putative cysteine protease